MPKRRVKLNLDRPVNTKKPILQKKPAKKELNGKVPTISM